MDRRRLGAAAPAAHLRDHDLKPSQTLFNLIGPIAATAGRCAARTAHRLVRRRIDGDFIISLVLWVVATTVVALLRLLFGRDFTDDPPIQQYQASPPTTNRSRLAQ
jgi:hypothetical protein